MDDEMAALRIAKKELRTTIRHRLSQLSTDSIAKQCPVATKNLISLPEYKLAKQVGIYLSMPQGELSTRDIVHDAFEQGKQIFVPYIHKHEKRSVMDMVTLHSIEDYENLKPDAWGIPSIQADSVERRDRVLGSRLGNSENASEKNPNNERSNQSRTIGGETLDLMVMPGVAFDESLGRLGHGKGFYDYFLERYQHCKTSTLPFLVGLSLDVQLLPRSQLVPTDPSDYKLNALIMGDGTKVRR
ncbi:hypothetical protein ACLMJK_005085 [Lecanora helva]